MYRKSSTILSNKESLNNYIEGFDVYNSYFITLLRNPNITKELYEIKVYDYRPDLIALDFYGSEKYMDILLLQVSINLSDYTRGTVLHLIPKNIIDQLLNMI